MLAIPESDTQFTEAVIDTVTEHEQSFSLRLDNGWHVGVGAGPIRPQPGMKIRLYGRGLGFPIRGVVIDGHVFSYRTEEEDRQYWSDYHAERQRQAHAAFDAAREAQLQAIAQLPVPYQQRLAGFMERAPQTAWEHQGYELHICQMAVQMAAAAQSADHLQELHGAHWKGAGPELSALLQDASGNQASAAARLAYLQLTQEAAIPLEHAGLCPLVGCASAGCWAVTQQCSP